jgi:cytochrome c biogenesis protein CcmG/thiol:disulfide interchange protein DsbE
MNAPLKLLGALALAAVATLIVIGAPVVAKVPQTLTPVTGRPLAPDFDLKGPDGKAVRLGDFRGKPLIVNFWATWCPPCREEFPLMVDAYADHADDELQILGVMHQDFADGARDFAADMGATWPILEDPQDAAYGDYLVVGLPTSFFIDADGVVRAFSLGGFSRDGLAAQLESILPQA